jgi:hypothetical protein
MNMIASAKANLDQRSATGEFVALARIWMDAKGIPSQAKLMAQEEGYSRIANILKATDVGTIGGDLIGSPDSWGSHLGYAPLSDAFLSSLSNAGCFDAAVPFMRPVPIKTRVPVSAIAASSSIVSEGAAKPVSSLEFDDESLPVLKAASIIVVSVDLVRLGGALADALISAELRKGVVASTDDKFVGDLIAATTPVASSGEFLYDLQTLLTAISGDSTSRYFVVMEPANAKRLATAPSVSGPRAYPELTVNGGSVAGVTVVVSDQLSSGQVLAFDATQVAADPGAVVLDASEHANVDLSGGNSPTFSLWQKNCRALRAERLFGFKLLRSTAAASLSSAVYASDSPA